MTGAARAEVNHKVVLAARPQGLPRAGDFRVETEALAPLGDGQVRADVSHLSIDAFIRTTLGASAGYHGSAPLGGTIVALGVGRVRESRAPGFAAGDWVNGPLMAQSVATLPAAMLKKIDVRRAPATAYLGALGLTTGLTAYVGVRKVGNVRAGETFVVSAAAGAVGCMAGQIAKIDGARVVGIAGGPAKCERLTRELGFDATVDYKRDDVADQLRAAAPGGVDVYFDNVGGELLDVVLDQIKLRARVVICGAISQYSGEMSRGVRGPALYLRLAERQSRMEGFAVNHFPEVYAEGEAALATWLAEDRVRLPEHVVRGLDNFGDALAMLFTGGHTGKLLLAI
jgi:NADPH-dependent curcumin reductase CurA